ncbi:PucR family transcriptional regulator [Limosilactobacillus fermentum]|uniref:PucR family transcriptional regulator n=1 Tax=Limosilactobacillus fermentum TaxID=1613 RepID=UPI001075A483|nr:PucR family transcriptional regulator [Limosilactobacillus fermentum]TFZ18778.1 PucR family transcriptional regulator [Limosilactobacillus fermentum]
MSTSLVSLLNLPRFAELKVLSTHKILDRPVYSVEITETPDVASYIPEHPIILTTAMYFKDDQSQLKRFMDTLAAKKVAALGIKVGRFIDRVDDDIVDYATKIDLPLIKVPSSQPLGTLLYQMLSYIWDAKTEQMTYALDIQKNFTRLMMHDVSSGRFVSELGKVIKVPVILLSPWNKVVSHSHFFSNSNHPVSYYTDQIKASHYQKIRHHKGSFLINDLDGNPIQILGYPVRVAEYFPFHLIILKPETIPYPISEFAIDQAVLVLTFMLYKNQKVQESLDTLTSDFFDQLLTNEGPAPAATFSRHWLELGAQYGLIKSNYYQVGIAHCVNTKKTASRLIYQREAISVANRWLQEKLPRHLKDVIIFKLTRSDELILIFQPFSRDTERILTNLSTELSKAVGIHLRFSIGNSYDRLSGIANSYIEARTAVRDFPQELSPTIVNYYHPKGLVGLFEDVDPDRIHYYCEKVLGDLAFPSEPAMQDLRKTLRCYLSYNCEITKTATVLFLHRNTIKYRIKQCEKILGKTIKDPQTSLNIRLALELSADENQADLLE